MPINSRTKGHQFEREICNKLNKFFNIKINKYKFKRVPLSGGFDKENFPGDIYSLSPLRFAKYWSVECKFYKEWKLEELFNGNVCNIMEWWEQSSQDAAKGDKLPILVFKKNHSQIYFMTLQTDFQEYLGPRETLPKGIITNQGKYGDLYIGLLDDFLDKIYEKDIAGPTP